MLGARLRSLTSAGADDTETPIPDATNPDNDDDDRETPTPGVTVPDDDGRAHHQPPEVRAWASLLQRTTNE